MKRSVSLRWSSLKVGIVLSFALLVMFYTSFTGGGTSIFQPKNSFSCYFKNVDGLMGGSPVWMSGVEVGNVSSVRFVNLDSLRKVRVDCKIKQSVWRMVTEGTEAELKTIGFLGDKYVEVYPGPVDAPAVEPGSVIPVRPAADAGEMFRAGKEAFREAGTLVDNLDGVLARINRGEGTLGLLSTDERLYTDLTRLMGELTELTMMLQQNQARIVASVETTARSVEQLTRQVDENSGTLGRLISDPALYDNLSATSARLDTIAARITSAEGSMGLMVSDTALYVEVVQLLTRVNNLVNDIEQNPRKYFKFSVF